MENNTIETTTLEMLGRVIEGRATIQERRTVFLNMTNPYVEELLVIALKTKVLFNDNVQVYETL